MGAEGTEPLPGPEKNCDEQAIYMKATVSKQGERRVLTGVLSIDGCEKCSPVTFRAVRQLTSEGGQR
jgi:hypothetical protein